MGVAVLAAAGTTGSSTVAPSAPFQDAVGGLGLSASVGVAWSVFAFDARLQGSCENEEWPLPGAHCPNPHHGAALADRPPLSPHDG